MKIAALLAPLFALLAWATPAFAQSSEQSSPADKQRFVAIERRLEAAPLDKTLEQDRSWAIRWLTDAPDVTVNVCLEPLNGVSDKTYPRTAEIVIQYSLAMAAFIIENPGKAEDVDAQQLAGVEGALNAYKAMRVARPDEKSPELDKLLAMQSGGQLTDFVQKAFHRCMAKQIGLREPRPAGTVAIRSI